MLKILSILLLLCGSWAQAADLAWNASVVDEQHAAPDGYRIHWGAVPGVYTGQSDAGNALTWHIPDDWYGSYYFAASAYNAAGQSGYSNEVIFTRDQPQQHIGATGLSASRYQVEGQQMASYVNSNHAQDISGGVSSVQCELTGITAGNLIVAILYIEGSEITPTISDGTSNLTPATPGVNPDTIDGTWDQRYYPFYLLSANGGDLTFTASWTGGRETVGLSIIEFSLSSGTWALDGQASYGYGGSSTLVSGSLTTTGSEVVCIGFGNLWTSAGYTDEQIGGADAIEIVDVESYSGFVSYRISTILNGTATALASRTAAFLCGLIAFKAAGGASAVPVIMRSYRARRN